MANTRQDRYETAATKAIKAIRGSLFESGLNELEAMTVIRVITSQLEKALKDFIDAPSSKRDE
jgi:hypothetical protein